MTLTEYLKSLKDVGDKATKGPWAEDDCNIICGDGIGFSFFPEQSLQAELDAEFITTARNNWDRLIKMNEVLLKEMVDIRDHSTAPFTGQKWTNYIHEVSSAALKECEELVSGRN